MYKDKKVKIHFVGIGGIGMSGIAEVLLSEGYLISGSDLVESEITKKLISQGAKIAYGHKKENVKNIDVVVISSAVQETNPELVEAKKQKIPVIPRAEMLAELMKMRTGIAIAGTHGKTTTTSMVAHIVTSAGFDPTIVIGGKVDALGGNAKLGKGEFIIAEADESDRSFLHLPAAIAVVTNIDNDHLNFYGTLENICLAFTDFINKIPFYGLAVLCVDDENIRKILPQINKPFRTYGFTVQAEIQAKNIQYKSEGTEFEVWESGKSLGIIKTKLYGKHNVLNALATLAVGLELNIPFAKISSALDEFVGVRRRFERKGEKNGITVVDDYGHHPTEIRTTLEGARKFWSGRIVVLFQPHRYTRTKDCYRDFLKAFDHADVLYVSDIYPAGEEPIESINSEKLVDDIRKHGHRAVEYIADIKHAPEKIAPKLKVGDLFITLGAGNSYLAGEALLKIL